MGLVLEPEEEAALFMYIVEGCQIGDDKHSKDHPSYPHNYSSLFEKYDRIGCAETIPAIIQKYGKTVSKATFRGHGKNSWDPKQEDADRTIAPGMIGKNFFSVSWDIGSAKTFIGARCCFFEITLKNAKVLQLSTISFDRSLKGGMYPPENAELVQRTQKERNEYLKYILNYDHEILVLGGGDFTPLGKPIMRGTMETYVTTYTGKTMGGRRRRTYRRKMSRKRKTTSS